MTTTAADVILQYSRLMRAWRDPNSDLVRFVRLFSADAKRSRGTIADTSMFYPPNTAPEAWSRIVGSDLRRARVFQVTANMCDAVMSTYRKTIENAGDTTRMSVSELPSDNGFSWLDEPAGLRDKRGKITKVRAISWSVLTIAEDNGSSVPGVRIIAWADTHVSDDYDSVWQPGVKEHSERTIGRLQLHHVFVMPLDRDLLPDSALVLGVSDNAIAWFRVLCMFFGTEVAAMKRAQLPRSVAGNLKDVKHAEITVVTLRRVSRDHASHGSTGDVDWSCQWVVQGHHRHLNPYLVEKHRAVPLMHQRNRCAVCSAKITWIRPHIKGPDGAPMKVEATVYRLSR